MSPTPSEFQTHTFQASLAHYNLSRITPALPSADWIKDEQLAHGWKLREGHFIESLRTEVAPMVLDVARNPQQFVAWFESLSESGPGQGDALFDWLAVDATLPEMRWFLTQEAAGEAGFDDLLACTQVKLPLGAKLECARNFWDEMGHGKAAAMHGPMLDNMVSALALSPTIATTGWQSLALSNAMLGMALTRRYAFHSIGALGAIELTAPGRMLKVSQGMRRLGMNAKLRAYFDLHAALDVSHSRCWNREIIASLVLANPDCAPAIAEGALIRLRCGQRCFEDYRHHFGLADPRSSQQPTPLDVEEPLC